MVPSSTDQAAELASWRDFLFDAASEVFSMMVGAELAPAADSQVSDGTHITGTVGIAGAVRAVFSLRCSMEAANLVASRMLGVPVEDAAAHNCDAIGEVCNMVAGQFKTKIGLEASCLLTVPSVITGRDYQVHSPAHGKRIQVPALFEGQMVSLALDIPK